MKLPELSGPEVAPPTVEQVQAIYEAAAEWFRPAVLLGAGLGLRQAEASGLTVDVIEVQVSGGARGRFQPLSRD